MSSPLQHSIPRSVVLHLLPGVALVAFYVLMVPQVVRWGFPPAFALFLGVPAVLVPVQLGYLLYQARRTTGTWSVASVVPYRAPLRPRTYVLLSIGVFVWFVVVASALALRSPRSSMHCSPGCRIGSSIPSSTRLTPTVCRGRS